MKLRGLDNDYAQTSAPVRANLARKLVITVLNCSQLPDLLSSFRLSLNLGCPCRVQSCLYPSLSVRRPEDLSFSALAQLAPQLALQLAPTYTCIVHA